MNTCREENRYRVAWEDVKDIHDVVVVVDNRHGANSSRGKNVARGMGEVEDDVFRLRQCQHFWMKNHGDWGNSRTLGRTIISAWSGRTWTVPASPFNRKGTTIGHFT